MSKKSNSYKPNSASSLYSAPNLSAHSPALFLLPTTPSHASMARVDLLTLPQPPVHPRFPQDPPQGVLSTSLHDLPYLCQSQSFLRVSHLCTPRRSLLVSTLGRSCVGATPGLLSGTPKILYSSTLSPVIPTESQTI